MAKLIVESIDSFDEKIIQKMIVKKTIENNFVVFTYNNKYGKGVFKISKELTEILKIQEAELKISIKPNSETKLYFNATYLKKVFTILCKYYHYDNNKLTVTYAVYDNNIEINCITIKITEI